jgi:hypothetical protein
MLSVIMLSVVKLSVVMLSVVMLSVVQLSVVMLSAIMLSVVAQNKWGFLSLFYLLSGFEPSILSLLYHWGHNQWCRIHYWCSNQVSCNDLD